MITGMGRNIRHLPCVSRRTGETGLCMFAYSCAKANGTHLGTCIDRFYFGSCCKIPDGSDVDLVQPIVSNHISNNNNKDDSPVLSSTFKTTYQKPSASSGAHPSLPNFSDEGLSSTMSMPISMSTVSRPLSISVPSPSSSSSSSSASTNEEFYSFNFTKTSSSQPSSSASHTAQYETLSSKTPFVNVTFTQSYSSPSSHVTTSPLVYTSTMMTTFLTGTHKPLSPYATTAYSKPLSKPTSKPSGKPKPPSQSAGNKPGPVKPKPKPTIKPTSAGTPSYPAVYSQATTASSFLNKTTLHSSPFTNNGLGSKPPSFTTDSIVPTKLSSSFSSSYTPPTTSTFPPPVQQFSPPSKKPTKIPTKPTIPPTVSSSPHNYVKIPVSTVSQGKPSTTTVSSMSTHTIQSIHNMFGSTMYPHTVSSSPEQMFNRLNSTLGEENTEKPHTKPWQSSSSEKPYATRPWPSLISSSSSSGMTTTQPSLVTWTTIDEVPGVILPDRHKPSTSAKPATKPHITKPSYPPLFSQSSTSGRPSSVKPTKPTTIRPGITSFPIIIWKII